MSFFAELKRRNVLRVAGLYLVAAWLITQVSSTVLPMFDVPAWVPRTIVIALAVGFVPALMFSWAFELTPQGFKLDSEVPPEQSIGKQTGRRIDRLIVVFLLGVIVMMLAERVWFAQRRTDSTEADTPRQSIAVLPFTDLSPNHDQEYFSDGMAEEILNALAKIRDLKVAGRTSSFSFKGKNEDLRTIGKALSVANVLEGSVRKQGDKVRITAQLIHSDDDFHVWSETYDGDLSDVFALQERIARAIAEKLQVSLRGDADKPLVPVATTNTEAYSKFLVAQSLVYQRFGDSLPRAIALLQEATKLDPHFARAWSKQAVAYAVLAQYTGGDWRPNWKASDDAAQRALAIDPNDAEAYAALSYNQFSQRHYAAMVEPMRRALALDPNNMTAIHWDGNELSALGRSHDSETRVDAGLANDPTNAPLVFYKAALRWRAGDTAGALAVNQRLQDTSSKYVDLIPAFIAAASGDFDEGARHFVRQHSAFGTKLTPAELDDVFRGIVLDEAHRQAALKIVEANSGDDWAPTFLLELGEPARSFALFENGTSGLSDAYLNWLWQTETWSRKARQDPAFQGFAQRLGMVDYWKKNGWPDVCKPAPESGPDAFTCQ
jgi:TolB-like protein/Tfp pilus assembly protein PilF